MNTISSPSNSFVSAEPIAVNEIGKYVGPFFYRTKALLSYDAQTGWKIRYLNLIQLFFRKVFGWHKSTHLDHVFAKSDKAASSGIITKKVNDYILSTWIKTNLVCLGNSNHSNAKIICFAENHLDNLFRTAAAHLINHQYTDEDIVLREGLEANQLAKPSEVGQTRKLHPNCLIQGWEPKGRKKIACLRKYDEQYEKLLKTMGYFEQIQENEEFEKQSRETIQHRIKEFVQNITDLNEYYQSKSKQVVNIKNFLGPAFEKLLSDAENPGGVLYYIVLSIAQKLEKEQERALYSNMTTEDLTELFEAVPKRNRSLADEIATFAQTKQTIFAIGGESHFLNYPPPYIDCKVVQAALQKYPFSIITRKHSWTGKIPRLNANLKRQPLV